VRSVGGRTLGVLVLGFALLLGVAPAASAHEERESQFPPGTGSVPEYRPFSEDTPHLVVCKPDSRTAIGKITDPELKALNLTLLERCGFEHMQAAVDAVEVQGTNIYVLPGLYREEPSWDAECGKDYDGGIVDYDLIVSCGEVINLVTVAADTDPSTVVTDCNQLCDLQIEGTGQRMEDVVLRGGFRDDPGASPDDSWVKHNGIKADRADGFYLRNLTGELFRENAFYVHETDGYVIDKVNARHNDLYGVLTFTSDHGVIRDCDTSFNGDSGVYPGSAADVNQTNGSTGPLTRWAVEVVGCNTHHNALGFSGTAGNSVYFHDNDVHHNQAGYVTDSFVGGHPGMPQDHAWLTGNRIYSNNNNYVAEFVQSGICARPVAERGYGEGTVCPAFPVPVGTGVLIAGGNRNFVNANLIYDNWRAGVKLLWVPGAIRGDTDLTAQYDTSNGNHFTDNKLGFHPAGVAQPNGLDFEWDEQGVGNCWEGNTSVRGEIAHDAALPLPTCASGGSLSPVGNVTKSAAMAPCATYHRRDEPDPPLCDWFDSPAQPAGRQEAPGQQTEAPAGAGNAGNGAEATALADTAQATGSQPGTASTTLTSARGLPATGTAVLPAVAGLVLGGVVLGLRRRSRPTS
jgi:hypothetical protein